MLRIVYTILFAAFLGKGALFAEDVVPKKKTVCLNMIVKDEKRVICRCLESVKPLIDYWVIVDTGSSDNTKELIRDYMKDIPGELYERPWVNFAHNRNEALSFAKDKADYVLIIDADEVFVREKDFKLPDLDKDFYYIMTQYGGTQYMRVQLVNNHLNWKWAGVVHEAIDTHEAKTSAQLMGIYNDVHTDGFRSTDPRKYYKDAAILEAALEKDPNDKRNVFYLAQSYRDAGEKEKSIEAYKRRVAMGGWDQEIYISLLQIALQQEGLELPPEIVIASYHKAHQYRPSRWEALYYLASYYRRVMGDNEQAYKIAMTGLTMEKSKDILFVENWIQDYGMVMELSITAYWTGRYAEADFSTRLLLTQQSLPQHVRETLDRNLQFVTAKLKENRSTLLLPIPIAQKKVS